MKWRFRLFWRGGCGSWTGWAIGTSFPLSSARRDFWCAMRRSRSRSAGKNAPGYSPSTLAAVISGLICAAELAEAHGSPELAKFLCEQADWIEGHLEDWTVTNDGVLLPEVKRHYMRIRPPECGEPYAREGCGKEMIHIANRGPGEKAEFEAREVVDGGISGACPLRGEAGG